MTKKWQTGVIAVAMACTAAAATAQTPPSAQGGAASAKTAASAQVSADKPAAGEVASAPIRCWWKTDRTAIRVGERFQLVLTCAVVETTGVTVVPAVNQLEAGAISLTPFEAVSGIRREDVVVPPWRYLQYEYTMRLLSEGFFGQDVSIPSLTVTYNLQAAGAGSEGRDQTYLLPQLPMRVLSLVPRLAGDIRDASGQTFAAVESRRFRATTAMVIAAIAFAFAAVLAALALARVVGRYRVRDPKAVRPLPAPSLLRGCLKSLADVRAEAARGGWTPRLTGRALAALRIAAALALDRSVAQEYVAADAPERQGQLAVRTGLLRRKRVMLSSATTASALTTRLENGRVTGAQNRVNLERISDALQVFSAATYGRATDADSSSLNSALDDAIAAIRRLRVRTMWPMRTAEAVARSFTGF
jgi:hypothetical protein